MRKLGTVLIFLWSSGFLGAWDLQSGISYFQGITYAREVSPGWSGTALEVAGFWKWDVLPEFLRIGTGLDVAVAGLGTQILVPLIVKWDRTQQEGWTWGLSGALLPGFTLTRPRPVFLWGIDGQIYGGWNWSPGTGIRLSTGLRYTSSPEYSAKVSQYSVLDIPLKISMVFQL